MTDDEKRRDAWVKGHATMRPFPHTGQDCEIDPRGPAPIAAALVKQRMEEADDGTN